MDFKEEFLREFVKNLAEGKDEDEAIKACSCVHYRLDNMAQVADSFRGNLEGFLDYLSKTYGWKIEIYPNRILIDENKDYCLCPLASKIRQFPHLCKCSEGYAEKMFTNVIGRVANVRVISSILQGDSTCRYEVTLKTFD